MKHEERYVLGTITKELSNGFDASSNRARFEKFFRDSTKHIPFLSYDMEEVPVQATVVANGLKTGALACTVGLLMRETAELRSDRDKDQREIAELREKLDRLEKIVASQLASQSADLAAGAPAHKRPKEDS